METVTSIEENVVDFEVVVSPNPFQDKLSVMLPEQTTGNINARLFNALGQMVWTKTNTTIDFDIPTENLVNGFYTLMVETDNGLIIKKLVKAQ